MGRGKRTGRRSGRQKARGQSRQSHTVSCHPSLVGSCASVGSSQSGGNVCVTLAACIQHKTKKTKLEPSHHYLLTHQPSRTAVGP
jgi:hypothetical protein